MIDKIATIGTIVALALGGFVWATETFVTEKDNVKTMQMMQYQLEQRIDMSRYEFVEDQYRKAERNYYANPNDMRAKGEYEDLKAKYLKLKQELGL